MKSSAWACWLFWGLFSVLDLSIGVLLSNVEVSSTSNQSLHVVGWALAFAIAAGLLRSWMIWRNSGWPGHWTLVSYAFILVNIEIAVFILLLLYLSPLSPNDIQFLTLDAGAGLILGAVTGWIISLFALSSPQMYD
jgi:hypothetical protein